MVWNQGPARKGTRGRNAEESDRNLDKIGQISGRLKKLAIATGKEIDSQQERIQNIEENADYLDIKIHVNTTKLSNIR